jgi:iron complex transport system ATP-binding protein
VELKNISYKIKEKYLIDDISLKIEKNGITLIIGPNGAGKSTLLKLIYKIINPTEGTISIDNLSLDEISSKKFLKRVSLLRDYSYLFHKIEVDYFLKLNRYRVSNSLKGDSYLENIIEIFELKTLLNRVLNTLSSGEKQRVMLASIFLLDTEYILLDEPFSALDISMKIKFNELFKKNFSDKKIIMITHDYFFLDDAIKIIALKNGKLFLDKEKISTEEFKKLFDIPSFSYNF